MPDNFFGLNFAQGVDRFPTVAPDDPELEKILARVRRGPAPVDETLTPPKDPYEGKGFGGQFLQSLKDDITGGDRRRQQSFANQAAALNARNEARRLAYTGEGIEIQRGNLDVDRGRLTVSQKEQQRLEAQYQDKVRSIKQLPEWLQAIGEINPGAVTPQLVATAQQWVDQKLKEAEGERQAENLKFFGPAGVRRSGASPMAAGSMEAGTPAPAPFLMPGLKTMSQLSPMAESPRGLGGGADFGASPSSPSSPFDMGGGTTFVKPPMRQLEGSMIPIGQGGPGGGGAAVPRVIGQRLNPFDPNDKRMMAGNVEANPDAGSLFRDAAKATVVDKGPMSIAAQGEVWKDAHGWHPDTRGELSANQQLLGYARLQNTWDKVSSNYQEMKRQESLMNDGMEAARKGDLAQGSQAVLVTFQKILDPTSVVRESEYARSAAGLSVLSQIKGFIDQKLKGGAGVPIEELEKYAQLAHSFLEHADEGLMNRRQRLENTAKEFKLNPELIFDSDAGKPAFTRTTPNGKVLPFFSQEEVDAYDARVAAEKARIEAEAAAKKGGGAPRSGPPPSTFNIGGGPGEIVR